MPETLAFCAFMALLNCAFYTCLVKWKVIPWMQYHVPEWLFPSNCLFCFFHRLAVIELVILFTACGSWNWWKLADLVTYPLVAAVLGLFFYRREE